jgi:hypothetical protein
MYTKEEIWSSFSNEIRIMKHLATKIPHDTHHHRPTEKQRSILELVQYISILGIAMFDTVRLGDWQIFNTYGDRQKEVTVDTFIAALERQEAEMKALFEMFDDAELNTEISLFGRTQRKGLYILDTLKMMCAYKMQLFLYIKSSGNSAITMYDLWAGIDTPQS